MQLIDFGSSFCKVLISVLIPAYYFWRSYDRINGWLSGNVVRKLTTSGLRQVSLFFATAISILIILFLENQNFRLVFGSTLSIFCFLEFIALQILGCELSSSHVQLSSREIRYSFQFLRTYKRNVVTAAVIALLFAIICFASPPKNWTFHASGSLLWLICVIVCAVHYSSRKRNKFDEFLLWPVRVPALLLAEYFGSSRYAGPRQPVKINATTNAISDKIVLVIDESVRADFLLNRDESQNISAFLKKHKKKIADFGFSFSSFNSSAASRMVLRSGLRVDQIPDINQISLQKPNIWNYAKKRGFATIYVDGFNYYPTLHSYMNNSETSCIDRILVAPIDDPARSDLSIAQMLDSILSLPGKQFVVIEKRGVHFPYCQAIPNYSWPKKKRSKKSKGTTSKKENEIVLDEYKRALNWSFDEFFNQAWPVLNRENTFLLYTSDHGQDFSFRKNKMTHANDSDPDTGEFLVPMLAFSSDKKILQQLRESAKKNFDQTSHFNIFPTLLRAFGYHPIDIQKSYGDGLTDIIGKVDIPLFTGQLYSKNVIKNRVVNKNSTS